MKTLFFLGLVLVSFLSEAQTINVVMKNGHEQEVNYNNRTINNLGITLNSGQFLDYQEISYIGTNHFDAYEKVIQKADKKGNEHLNIAFTGDQNLYELKLKKLEEKRNDAHVARGAGGLLLLIGAISGDRDLYAAGAVVYGAGTIARDINTEKTINAQNDAIVALQEGDKSKDTEETIVAEYRREWGNENVDGIFALIEKDYERALALANVGELSKDVNHQVAAVWLKALIYADQKNNEALEEEFEHLVTLDPELESIENASSWMEVLLQDLDELRKG